MPGQKDGVIITNSVSKPSLHHLPKSDTVSHRENSTLKKFLPIPGLVIATVISSLLVYATQHGPFVLNGFYNFVENSRTSVQAIISILTHILGFGHLYVLTSVISLSMRSLLQHYAHTPDRVKMWRALSSKSLDLSLPFKLLLPAVVLIALTVLPSTLWTGALTPNLVTQNIQLHLPVPYYAPDPGGKAWNQTWIPNAPHSVLRNPFGTFSYTPAYDRGRSMINTAAGVIFDKDRLGQRPRSDKSGFAYSSRSYGVGSSVGLIFPANEVIGLPSAFSYNETGYATNVNCSFNASSQWKIHLAKRSDSANVPDVFYCDGGTIENPIDRYIQYSTTNGSNIVAIDADANHIDPRASGIISVATGPGAYSVLNNTQCSVTFVPTLFQVNVDVASSNINVTKLGTDVDMDPTANANATFETWTCNPLNRSSLLKNSTNDCAVQTVQGQPGLGNIATRALRQLVDLSILDISLQQSDLGEMFLSEVQDEELFYTNSGNSPKLYVPPSTTAPNLTELVYIAEQAFKSLLDDSLLAFSSAQLALQYNSSTKNATMVATVNAVEFGSRPYVYSLFAFNLLLILIMAEEMIRTKGWKNLPQNHYLDLKGVIATSMTRKASADIAATAAPEKETSILFSNPSDQIATDMHVHLKFDEQKGTVELVGASREMAENEHENNEEKSGNEHKNNRRSLLHFSKRLRKAMTGLSECFDS